MTKPSDTIYQLIKGQYPDYAEVEFLSTHDALSQEHFLKFYIFRGQIDSVTPLIMKEQEVGDQELPDRYEYQAKLKDEVGSITLHSPIYSDERKIYKEIASAFNKEAIVEVMVYISPSLDIDADSTVQDDDRKIITLWPVKLRVVNTFPEDAQMTHTNFGWDITFRRKTEKYPDEDGFFYLHRMLSKPNEEISSQELFVSRKGTPKTDIDIKQIKDFLFNENTKDEEIVKYLKKVPRKKRSIVEGCNHKILQKEEEIGGLNPDVDSEIIKDLEEEILVLKEAIFSELGFNGSQSDTTTEIYKPSANYVGKAIRRALKKIADSQPNLHVLLVPRIHPGAQNRYIDDLDHPIHWLT